MKFKSNIKCECLDFVEGAHQNRVYPLMYCHMEISGKLDIEKLKNAVRISGEYVPQILYAYDFRRNRFTDRGFTIGDVFQTDAWGFRRHPVWDLSRQPQLKIAVHCREDGSEVIIGMSHIVTDGAGFLQYIYLLAALYNGRRTGTHLKNTRDISRLLKEIRVYRRTDQERHRKTKCREPLLTCSTGTRYYLVKRTISPGDFKKLHRKAKQYHVTINDVFMTAYARVIAGILHKDQVVIPCPADLRRFESKSRELTVANMTGIYRDIVINCEPGRDFTSILLQVHLEMELQKARFRCFKGIHILDSAYRFVPGFILGKIIRKAYQPSPVSYTNIGVIEQEKLFFQGCDVKNCIITGTYRQPPDFQLNVSSFRNICTLNCALIGGERTRAAAENILELTAEEVLDWAKTRVFSGTL